jgi:hypothetical protein
MGVRLGMERAVVSRMQRLPGLPSSRVHLDVSLGRDDDIDVEDWLGDRDLINMVRLPINEVMERKLKL